MDEVYPKHHLAKKFTVYIMLFPNGKSYVGMTNDFARRIKDYKRDIRHNKQTKVVQALKFFTIEKVIFTRLVNNISGEWAEKLETRFINNFDLMNPEIGYNQKDFNPNYKQIANKAKYNVALFESKIDKLSHLECWIWVGRLHPTGYGVFDHGVNSVKAHRISYEIYNGPIINKLHVLHSCDNRKCVNPNHLRLGTHQENMNDKVKRNRQARLPGIMHPMVKLTEDQVREIRKLYSTGQFSQRKLGRMFSISQTQIKDIVKRKSWSHLD